MNKNKLVKLAQKVLTDIDEDSKWDLKNALEKELLFRLQHKFLKAKLYLKGHKEEEDSYLSVKPILDDAINELLK